MAKREESPDTTLRYPVKRFLSECSEDSPSKIRKLSEKCDSSDETGSSATVSVTNIPNWTINWTRGVLDQLRIQVATEQCPASLFKMWLKPVMTNKNASLHNIEKRARTIIEHLESFNTLSQLDFNSVYDINSKSARPFFNISQDGCTLWTNPTPPLENDREKHWFHMFTAYVDKLAEDLRYMCSIHQEGRSLKEAMYGSLFQDFLGLFGLHSIAAPLVETKDLKIGNSEVCSVPDMLLMDRQTDGVDRKILAVIEARRAYGEVENNDPLETRSRRNGQLHTESELEISDKLSGKHVGDLLLHCPKSSHEDGILGMIVQNTHVAFTYLSCDKEQFENIAHGNGVQQNNPKITVSKSYNFLKASDRKELVEPLVILGLLQTIP